MTIDKRIEAFTDLGLALKRIASSSNEELAGIEGQEPLKRLAELIYESKLYNPWFDEWHMRKCYIGIAHLLEHEQLKKWCTSYQNIEIEQDKWVGVVMAGNIPAVGFHDFLSILCAGFGIKMKLSAADNALLPAMADYLAAINPWFRQKVQILQGPIKDVDAVIATGSNNTARYFEYYFSKWPNIIRKNRNALGILTGLESKAELAGIASDIMSYYGLGCRNISKLLVPNGYVWEPLFEQLEAFKHLAMNHKYFNNYEYQKAIMLVNKVNHFDIGFLLLTKSQSLASPISVVHFEEYTLEKNVQDTLMELQDQIQCVVSLSDNYINSVRPGESQLPGLSDYADGVDTMLFLSLLK